LFTYNNSQVSLFWNHSTSCIWF